MHKILEEISVAAKLREGTEGVRRILRAAATQDVISLKELAREVTIPLPVVSAVRREMEKRGVLERAGGGLRVSKKGRALLVEAGVVTQNFNKHMPSATSTKKETSIPRDMSNIVKKIESAHSAMPGVDVTLDQSYALPETSLRRVLYAMDSDALAGRNVIFLGDDDLISLAASYVLNASGAKARLSVVELDGRITSHILKTNSGVKPGIECIVHNLRNPLPPGLTGKFHTFFADPPYTPAGLKLFLSRAAEALENASGMQGFLSFAHRDPDTDLETFSIINECGFSILEIIPKFNKYAGGGIIGNSSRMIHLISTSKTKPVIDGIFDDDLYSGEFLPTFRIYECTLCDTRYEIGSDRKFQTIEILKQNGCEKCDGDKFRRVEKKSQ